MMSGLRTVPEHKHPGLIQHLEMTTNPTKTLKIFFENKIQKTCKQFSLIFIHVHLILFFYLSGSVGF